MSTLVNSTEVSDHTKHEVDIRMSTEKQPHTAVLKATMTAKSEATPIDQH